MEYITIGIVSFLSGIMASMGLGGGMVLILYLTLFLSTNQFTAQGINLIFFIPIGIFSLILHTKKGLVKWKVAILPIIFGALSASIFSYISMKASSDFLQKAFAFFIAAVGIVEFFKKAK